MCKILPFLKPICPSFGLSVVRVSPKGLCLSLRGKSPRVVGLQQCRRNLLVSGGSWAPDLHPSVCPHLGLWAAAVVAKSITGGAQALSLQTETLGWSAPNSHCSKSGAIHHKRDPVMTLLALMEDFARPVDAKGSREMNISVLTEAVLN